MSAPELLLHPTIPKPLHGVNPRYIMGREAWEEAQAAARAAHGYKCHACGVSQDDALYRKLLEAHEVYAVDYERGRMELRDIVALCHACHNFIHSGKLLKMATRNDREMPLRKAWYILYKGFKVLKEAGLPPNPFALRAASSLYEYNISSRSGEQPPKWAVPDVLDGLLKKYPAPDETATEWSKWRLIYRGEEYPPLCAEDSDHWLRHYNPDWSDGWRRAHGY